MPTLLLQSCTVVMQALNLCSLVILLAYINKEAGFERWVGVLLTFARAVSAVVCRWWWLQGEQELAVKWHLGTSKVAYRMSPGHSVKREDQEALQEVKDHWWALPLEPGMPSQSCCARKWPWAARACMELLTRLSETFLHFHAPGF